MEICFIGGGVSSVFASLLLKRKNKNINITIFENKDNILSKLKASGNGRCNINNYSDDPSNYNKSDFVEKYLNECPFIEQEKILNSFNIYLKDIKGYLYPVSESSNTIYKILLDQLNKEGINIKYNHKLIDFKKNDRFTLYFENGSIYECDYLVFSTGGKSYPNLGNIGNVFDILKSKGITITELKPGLTPLKVKENVIKLFGTKIKCRIKLYDGDKYVYMEEGEINFKKDGIGGILINNLSSIINWKKIKEPILKLDFSSYNINENNLNMDLINPLYSFFDYKFADEIIKNMRMNKVDINKENILDYINNKIIYHVKAPYDFLNAQVTNGGISLNEINDNFELKKIDNAFAIGEILDIDGLCGGFNLKWTLLSAHFLIKLNDFNN
ncbi:MAG: aminoacetone oxidase family FAD-binding enzyme [Bacilli bacterium]